MSTLHWIGKEKVINHHMDVPFRVLEHAYGFDNGTQTAAPVWGGLEGAENKIIQDDNLEALKFLLPEYVGRVKYIYVTKNYMTKNNLIFKKAPRDVTKF